jgi:hypothetical protein
MIKVPLLFKKKVQNLEMAISVLKSACKGQLISKCPVCLEIDQKTNKVFVRFSVPASKKRSNQKSSVREAI